MSARIELRPVALGCSPDAPGTVCCHEHGTQGVHCPSLTKPSKRPHYLRLVAANGQVLATSEFYSTRQNARRAVKAWLYAFAEVLHADEYADPLDIIEAPFEPLPVWEFDAAGERVTR